MKRLTVPLTVKVLIEDDASPYATIDAITRKMVDDVEAVSFGRHEITPVRTGTCRVGPHEFVVDHLFSQNKPVPDVCRSHWYTTAIEDATDEHAPFFDEVRRLTGLEGHIWQSGGMTMTIVVPVAKFRDGIERTFPPEDTAAELDIDTVEFLGLDGTGRDLDERFPYTWDNLHDDERARLVTLLQDVYPCYMGLNENDDEAGLWVGSLQFYATAEDGEDGEGPSLLPYPYEPMTPQQWAAKLAEHYAGLRP